MHAPPMRYPTAAHTPPIESPTATRRSPIDNPTVAAPGDGQSTQAVHGQKKVKGSVDRDNMRSMVKDCIIQLFGEYSCLFCVFLIIPFSGEAGVTFGKQRNERFYWKNMLGVAFRNGLILVNWNKNHRHEIHGYPDGMWTPRNLRSKHLKEIVKSARQHDNGLHFQPWPECMYVL
jgi:hypothetical protein